jgi:hypothetical protein
MYRVSNRKGIKIRALVSSRIQTKRRQVVKLQEGEQEKLAHEEIRDKKKTRN